MATVPMTKMGIIGYGNEKDSIIKFLQREGIVELLPLKPSNEQNIDIEQLLQKIDSAVDFLLEFADEKPHKPILSPQQVKAFISDFDLDGTVSRIEELRDERNRLAADINHAEAKIDMLEPWAKYPTPLTMMRDTMHCRIEMGTVPAHMVETFQHEIIEQKLFFWREISRGHDGMHIVVLFHNSISKWMDALLAQVEFTDWEPKEFSGTPADEISQFEGDIASARERLHDVSERAKILAENIIPLWVLADHYEQIMQQYAAIASAENTERTFIMQGWSPKRNFHRLKQRLETTFDTVEVMELSVLPEDEPPVALKNTFFIEAFEIITDLYGRPRKGMIDPTPFVAPFFAAYFALCLTDAGYGLFMTLIAVAGLIIMKQASSRKFFRMILYVGILTIIAGIITGGYFGASLPQNAAQASGLVKLALSLKLFDPLRDIMTFFAISITLGVIQLSVGFLVAGYMQLRASRKLFQYLHAIVIALAWTGATIGLGMFVMPYVLPDELAAFGPLGVSMLKFSAIGIIGTHLVIGPLAGKSIGASIGNAFGFDGLYGIIGVFSDLLSFVRITALGLSTGIVAGVITNMTLQMKGALFIVGILILIGGHIFYCLFSALGAFVHPTRLQFVEFFSKFYESGGKSFEPFRKQYRRIEVI